MGIDGILQRSDLLSSGVFREAELPTFCHHDNHDVGHQTSEDHLGVRRRLVGIVEESDYEGESDRDKERACHRERRERISVVLNEALYEEEDAQRRLQNAADVREHPGDCWARQSVAQAAGSMANNQGIVSRSGIEVRGSAAAHMRKTAAGIIICQCSSLRVRGDTSLTLFHSCASPVKQCE